MGAVYDVTLKLKYNSEQDVIDATESFVSANSGYAQFSNIDYSSVVSAIQIILPKRGFRIINQTDTSIECDCGFDASYGWEVVMMDWFNSIVEDYAVQDSSAIKIYPDSGWEVGVAKGGTAHWKNDEGSAWGVGSSGYEVQTPSQPNYPTPEPIELVPMVVDDPELQEAIDFFNEYGEDEFEHICIDEDTDLSDVGLMFTTVGDDVEYDVQASADLIHPTLKYYVNGELVGQDKFNSLSDMINKLGSIEVAIEGIFSWLCSRCSDFIDWDEDDEE